MSDEVKSDRWAVDDDTAFELESQRLDGAQVEDLLEGLVKQKKEMVYPLREDNLYLDEIIDKVVQGIEIQEREREFMEDNLPSELLYT